MMNKWMFSSRRSIYCLILRGERIGRLLTVNVPLKNFSLIWRRHHFWWRDALFRCMIGAQDFWAVRDLYCVTPAATRDLGFSGLIGWIDWLIDWLFTVLGPTQVFYTYMKMSKLPAANFRPMLGAQGLWAGRDLYHVTLTMTRDLGFSGLIRRTTPFSRLLRHVWGCRGPILTRIFTAVSLEGPTYVVSSYDTQGNAGGLYYPVSLRGEIWKEKKVFSFFSSESFEKIKVISFVNKLNEQDVWLTGIH
jgi:hypothetical protein